MSIGNSGRIVIEIDPIIKRNLHSALAKDGISLKEWFLGCAIFYLENQSTPNQQFIINEEKTKQDKSEKNT